MKTWLLISNVLLATWMIFLSVTATLIGDSSIQGELALSAPKAQWVTTFYLLGISSVVPATTWLSQRFGQKSVYLSGLCLFTISSAMTALADNFAMIGLARFFEGSGAGLIFPVGLSMIVGHLPKEKLSLGLNLYIAIGFGAGLGLGLPLSGYLSQFHSWRDIFLLMVPLGVVAITECWINHEPTPPKSVEPFDVGGYGAFITFIASLLVALSFGALPSTNGGWTAPFILAMFALAAVSLIATVLIERRKAKPAIAIGLFRDPVFSLSIAAMVLLGMALFSSLTSATDFMFRAHKYEKFIVGLISSTYGITMAVASVLTTQLIKKVPAPFLILSGLAILITSYFLNDQITLQSPPPQVMWILFLRGLGVGLSLAPIMGMGIRSVPKESETDATTLLTFFRQIGGTYGGTVMLILTIKRGIFHAARFSEQTNTQIPGYRVTWQGLQSQFFSAVSDKGILAGRQAKAAIVENVETQAYIEGLNDALVVFGWVTLAIAVGIAAVIGQRMWVKWRERQKA